MIRSNTDFPYFVITVHSGIYHVVQRLERRNCLYLVHHLVHVPFLVGQRLRTDFLPEGFLLGRGFGIYPYHCGILSRFAGEIHLQVVCLPFCDEREHLRRIPQGEGEVSIEPV